jgi:hypothetical protein
VKIAQKRSQSVRGTREKQAAKSTGKGTADARDTLNKSVPRIENVVGTFMAEKIQPVIPSKADEERRSRPVSQLS